jgi:hypothetical protein
MKVLPNAFVAVLLAAMAISNTGGHVSAVACAFAAGFNVCIVVAYMAGHRI